MLVVYERMKAASNIRLRDLFTGNTGCCAYVFSARINAVDEGIPLKGPFEL